MRKVFHQTEDTLTEEELSDIYPWLCAVRECHEGYMIFESWTDVGIWDAQV